MKFLSTAASVVLATAGLSRASPLNSRQATEKFRIETQVLLGNDDSGSNKGGLYIFSYHTGAGTGKATGQQSPVLDTYFYLNDTTLLWTYEGNDIGPWRTSILYGAYQSFEEISISIATNDDATPGFYLDGNILKSNASADGWLMCDSWYTAPQLYALAGYVDPVLPSSCSYVQLVAVPVA